MCAHIHDREETLRRLQWLLVVPVLLSASLVGGCLGGGGGSFSTEGCNFQGVREAIETAASLKASDRESLLGRVDYAVRKYREGKYEEAASRLEDFRKQVMAMRDSSKPKISPEDADTILSLAELNVACVRSSIPDPLMP